MPEFLSYSVQTILVMNFLTLVALFFLSLTRYALSPGEMAIAMAICLLDSIRGYWLAVCSAGNDQKSFAIFSSLDAFLRPICSVVGVLVFGPNTNSILLGTLVGGITSAIASGIRVPVLHIFREWKLLFKFNIRTDFINYCIPFIPLNCIAWLTASSDRFIIAEVLGNDSAGIYIAMYAVVSRACSTCFGAVELIFRPFLFTFASQRDEKATWDLLTQWIVVSSFLGVCVISGFGLLHGFISSVLLSSRYGPNSSMMPILAAGLTLFHIGNIFELRIRAMLQSALLIVAHSIIATIAVLSAYLMGYQFGLAGVVLACPIYYFAYMVVLALLSKYAARKFFEHNTIEKIKSLT